MAAHACAYHLVLPRCRRGRWRRHGCGVQSRGHAATPICFFFSSGRRHTKYIGDWSSDVCSSDLIGIRNEGHGAENADGTGAENDGVERSEERRVGKESRDRVRKAALKKYAPLCMNGPSRWLAPPSVLTWQRMLVHTIWYYRGVEGVGGGGMGVVYKAEDMRLHRFVFFFQAEDGIRNTSVTGVQTCALPISSAFATRAMAPRMPMGPAPRTTAL